MTISSAKQQIMGMLSAAIGGFLLTSGGALSQYQHGSIAQLVFCKQTQTHINSLQPLGLHICRFLSLLEYVYLSMFILFLNQQCDLGFNQYWQLLGGYSINRRSVFKKKFPGMVQRDID